MSCKSWLGQWPQTYTSLTASPQTLALQNYNNAFYSSYSLYPSGVLNARLGFAVPNYDSRKTAQHLRGKICLPAPTHLIETVGQACCCSKQRYTCFVVREQNLEENSFLLTAGICCTRYEYKTEPRLTL